MASSMDELERSVVQLWEAKRLAEFNDVAHGRLALLLLDNAAEMSLRRSAQRRLQFADMYGVLLSQLNDVDPNDTKAAALRSEFEPKVVSRRRRGKIDRNFAELVDFVAEDEEGVLPSEFARCLKILHRYRNAAHHRDAVRPDVLGPAVQILFYLCCELLKRERPLTSEIAVAPASILGIFGGTSPESTWPGNSCDASGLGQQVADHLAAEMNLDHGGIAAALSEHLIGRLTAVLLDLETIGEAIPPATNRVVTLRLVQQAPRDAEEAEAPTPDNFWTRPLPVTEDVLVDWFEQAERLGDVEDAQEALRAFAAVEEPLEALEEPVGRFIDEIDRAEERRMNELRGR